MAIFELGEQRPSIGEGTFVAPDATVIGDVTLGRGCFIGPGARIRGDYGTIVIGDGTAVEDNVVVHARPGERCEIGRNVTLGHACIVHNATLHDWAVIGMGAVVSDYAVVGEWGVVGEGAVVKNRQEIPARAIAVGVPARVVSTVSDGYIEQWSRFKGIYVDLARERYPRGLRRIEGAE
ncbi:MAG TPA: gamma carbonic anhydrase family protein [Thermoplasmata archaeon]|nr:gamma carbonic anhydrase family protein [Thermoplasmata archaeon]